jgi:predicted lactoylglutathione lyase
MACQRCVWIPAHDLLEARRLYAALGYEEVPAFNHGRYAEHWFAKSLV